jgi:hypothetical protein
MPVMRNTSDTHHLRTFPAIVPSVAMALAGLTLAACGGGEGTAGGSSAAAGAADRTKLEQAALEHAACMRRRGIDVPDPKAGNGGIILSGPRTGTDHRAQERAVKQCGRYLRNVPPPKLSDEQKTAMRDGALRHARCMRAQGIEFPDPKFDGKAGITVNLGEGFDPADPRMRQAEQKCRRLLPRPPGGAPG